MTDKPRDVFFKVVNGVAGGRLGELPDLYAEKTDVRHPFSTPDAPALLSRDDLRRHFRSAEPPAYVRRVVDPVVHETVDPEVIVAEFSYEFSYPDGKVFLVPAVFVMRVRDGEIVESRDYFDPIRGARARGTMPQLVAQLAE